MTVWELRSDQNPGLVSEVAHFPSFFSSHRVFPPPKFDFLVRSNWCFMPSAKLSQLPHFVFFSAALTTQKHETNTEKSFMSKVVKVKIRSSATHGASKISKKIRPMSVRLIAESELYYALIGV